MRWGFVCAQRDERSARWTRWAVADTLIVLLVSLLANSSAYSADADAGARDGRRDCWTEIVYFACRVCCPRYSQTLELREYIPIPFFVHLRSHSLLFTAVHALMRSSSGRWEGRRELGMACAPRTNKIKRSIGHNERFTQTKFIVEVDEYVIKSQAKSLPTTDMCN